MNGEDSDSESVTERYPFGDPRIGYDSEQEVYYGPGMPNPDDPGAGCYDDSSEEGGDAEEEEEEDDEEEEDENKSEDSDRTVPVPEVASSAQTPRSARAAARAARKEPVPKVASPTRATRSARAAHSVPVPDVAGSNQAPTESPAPVPNSQGRRYNLRSSGLLRIERTGTKS